MAIRPLFSKVALATCLAPLAACALDPGPPGGERPALAAVADRPAPRYDGFERTVLRDSLAAAAHETRRRAAVVEGRIAGRAGAEPAPLPPPPALAPPPTPPRLPAPELGLEDNLVTAEGLVGLAEAVGRDRVELARRARIREALAAPPEVEAERVTAVVFPPGGATLDARERDRLARALAAGGHDGDWLVRTGGVDAAARAAAVERALVELGVDAARITVERLERDVAVAEIAVRR